MASFGILILASIAVIGFLLWQVISFAQSVNDNVQNTKEQFDVRGQACENEQFSRFLPKNSEFCRQDKNQ